MVNIKKSNSLQLFADFLKNTISKENESKLIFNLHFNTRSDLISFLKELFILKEKIQHNFPEILHPGERFAIKSAAQKVTGQFSLPPMTCFQMYMYLLTQCYTWCLLADDYFICGAACAATAAELWLLCEFLQ